MKRLWLILFVISSACGQSLNFTNKDSTIIIKPSQLVNLNGTRYTLIHTDYNKQHIVLETEIPDSAPFKYLREPIEGAWFYFGILKIPIYKYIKNKISASTKHRFNYLKLLDVLFKNITT